uniref:Uncharacterized protein n=1 Tax=Hordeum vulgare subsp. vulgare TaxID=112509 RepID=A0A8I6WYD1_HORVV
MKGGSMVCTIALLFIGCLVMVGQCRPEPDSAYEGAHSNVTMVVSSLDQRKITLKWCIARDCKTKREPSILSPICYCCFNAQGAPCFKSLGDCQNQCPNSLPA